MRLTTGKGAAAASRGTTGGTTPTCGAVGASTIESSIGSSSRDTTSAVNLKYISPVEHGLVSSLSLLELWPWVNDLRLQKYRKDWYLRVKHSSHQHLSHRVRHSGHGCVAVR